MRLYAASDSSRRGPYIDVPEPKSLLSGVARLRLDQLDELLRGEFISAEEYAVLADRGRAA